MKTLPIFALVAAPVAFIALPVNFVAAVSVLFGTGLVALLISDYGHAPRPLAWGRTAVAALPAPRTERFGLAA
ncbi:MAG: hypothetical protein HZA93_10055 [Verrucomicrobia bacterium]|nr:hypothetical protein [Verrucomicrobiota bacterium]